MAHTHTQRERNIDTHRHMHTHIQTQIPFVHFTLFGSFGIHIKDTNFIFGIPHRIAHAQTLRHVHT